MTKSQLEALISDTQYQLNELLSELESAIGDYKNEVEDHDALRLISVSIERLEKIEL